MTAFCMGRKANTVILRSAQDDSKKKDSGALAEEKDVKMPLSWCNSEINMGGICYFLITTVSLWSLELTCFDAGQGELQTPRQSKNLRYKEHHDERISRFSGTSVCRARGPQPDGQRAAPKARGD
jgi:hypothetical protein